MCLVHKEKTRCCKSQKISMKCFTNHLFFWRLILVSDETCYETSLGTWRGSWHLQQKIRYPEHPNLMWFLTGFFFHVNITHTTWTPNGEEVPFSWEHNVPVTQLVPFGLEFACEIPTAIFICFPERSNWNNCVQWWVNWKSLCSFPSMPENKSVKQN